MKTYPLSSFTDLIRSPVSFRQMLDQIRHLLPSPSSIFRQDLGGLQQNLDFILGEIDPGFRFRQHTAEVRDIIQETPTTRTFVLKPSIFWKGFVPGQYIPVQLEIDGIWVQRFYSISSSLQTFRHQGLISITVKRQNAGRLSPQLHQQWHRGSVVRIGTATGQFVLASDSASANSATVSTNTSAPSPQRALRLNTAPTSKLLMIAAGSGITPILSMLESLAEAYESEPGGMPSVVMIYHVRNAQEIVAAARLEALTTTIPGFTLRIHQSDREGRVTPEQLQRDCPDLAERQLYLCGPEGFMDSVIAFAMSLGAARSALKLESFGSARSISSPQQATDNVNDQDPTSRIRFARSGTEISSSGQHTLLELAELAGLQPKYGCRAGICRECTCSTSGGRVMNRLTGELMPEEQQQVQACISIPLGDLAVTNW